MHTGSQTAVNAADLENGPRTDRQSEAQETSSFLERLSEHHLTDRDQNRLMVAGGATMVSSAAIGELVGYLKTGLPIKALFHSMGYMGVAFGVMCLAVIAYMAHGQCAKSADPARQPILPPRPSANP